MAAESQSSSLDGVSSDVEARIREYLYAIFHRDRPELRSLEAQFLVPFMLYPDDAFTFLDRPEEVDKAAEFALHANNVPVSLGDWHFSTSLLWQVYRYWLD